MLVHTTDAANYTVRAGATVTSVFKLQLEPSAPFRDVRMEISKEWATGLSIIQSSELEASLSKASQLTACTIELICQCTFLGRDDVYKRGSGVKC